VAGCKAAQTEVSHGLVILYSPRTARASFLPAARPDLLPKPYLDALSELQDRLPSFPSSIAFEVRGASKPAHSGGMQGRAYGLRCRAVCGVQGLIP